MRAQVEGAVKAAWKLFDFRPAIMEGLFNSPCIHDPFENQGQNWKQAQFDHLKHSFAAQLRKLTVTALL